MKSKSQITRGEVLEGAPLRYAPANELGVVFLFARLARKWRLRVDAIQPRFPDCIAYQKIQGKEKRIRIEFELNSRSFKTHGHDPRQCDWIVCWEHDWPDAPSNLRIVELRREYGLGFNVWIMPVNEYKEELEATNAYNDEWSLPSQCHKDDLILFYFTLPEKSIGHIFVAAERARKMKAGWKPGKDYWAGFALSAASRPPFFSRTFATTGYCRPPTSFAPRCRDAQMLPSIGHTFTT